MTSEKQIAANRRNSQKSTGPKSHLGKSRSKLNALRHGLYSKEVVIRTGDGKEDIKEFEEFLDDLIDTYKPSGPLEEQQIDFIATTSWRIKRAIRKERGEIQGQLDTFEIDEEIRSITEIIPEKPGVGFRPARLKYPDNTNDIKSLVQHLRKAKAEIEENGFLCNSSLIIIGHVYLNLANPMLENLKIFSYVYRGYKEMINKHCPDDPWTPGTCKISALYWIDVELDLLKNLEEKCEKREKLQRDSYKARKSIPTDYVSESQLRIESALESKLYRAIYELERFQMTRQISPE